MRSQKEIVAHLRKVALNMHRNTEPMENCAATLIEQQAKRIHELELENRGAQLEAGMSRLMFANMQKQEQHIADLEAALTKDAARYRWMRSRIGRLVFASDPVGRRIDCVTVSDTLMDLSADSLDGAIDAAMKDE